MAHDLNEADNYVVHAETALSEARTQISEAAGVSIDNPEARAALGEALGQAHNAISRAQRDLELHRGREQRRDDRDTAENYFKTLGFPDDGQAVLQIAVLPLPLEEERVSLDKLGERQFDRNLTASITRFNNEERTQAGYLMAVPGGMGSSFDGENLRFATTPQGAGSPSQQALILPTAAFVYWQPLWRVYEPPRFFLEMVKGDLRLTLMFAMRLYDELNIVPRAIAVQGTIRHIEDFQLMVPGYFAHAPNVLTPKPGVTSLVLPLKPLILTGTIETMLTRALPAADASVRANFTTPP